MTHEEIYDERISPLMAEIIEICKTANIPMHASFYLGDDLACTSHFAPTPDEIPGGNVRNYLNWNQPYNFAADRATRGA